MTTGDLIPCSDYRRWIFSLLAPFLPLREYEFIEKAISQVGVWQGVAANTRQFLSTSLVSLGPYAALAIAGITSQFV
jgi:hypothetical protein